MKIYEDYDEAAGNSQARKAISNQTWDIQLLRGRRKLKIVKPLFQPPFAVYATSPSIECREWDFPYKLVDQITAWEPF